MLPPLRTPRDDGWIDAGKQEKFFLSIVYRDTYFFDSIIYRRTIGMEIDRGAQYILAVLNRLMWSDL